MKIYTKTGDNGTTSLFGGQRVEKNSLRIEACGHIDELNSFIGTITASKPDEEIAQKLTRIQKELFTLGADVASPPNTKINFQRISKRQIKRLELEIDKWSKQLPPLRNFILPDGSQLAANLHLARAITRRAERAIVALSHQEKINKNTLSFINRLSDWFFTLARIANHKDAIEEKNWP